MFAASYLYHVSRSTAAESYATYCIEFTHRTGSGQVGSGVFQISRVGSGRVGSGQDVIKSSQVGPGHDPREAGHSRVGPA